MSQSLNNDPEGILLVDKPQGMTSHDVVDRVRRAYRMKKVGHAGTLDPMATGLLLILVGKATKVSQYLMSLDKEYVGTVLFGQVTDSQDADGEVIEESSVPEMTEEFLRGQFSSFLGDQYQTPPMYSAKKINGQPLYKLARKGKTVAREPRVIHISKFELTRFDLPRASFIVGSSKGAYIRTLAHDLGKKIGCGGHLCELRRTGVGQFRIEKSDTLEEIENSSPTSLRSKLMPVNQAVPTHAL
ncbi:MAG: tRNA pseudouridine(55) synthase TruB [Verrucomicrobiota bacterium]